MPTTAPQRSAPLHMNWNIGFTLPAGANLTDTPLFANDGPMMMAVSATDGRVYVDWNDIPPAEAQTDEEIARWYARCNTYISGGLPPPRVE